MKQLYTRWGKNIDREKPLNEYPRPQMKRDSFINLNGEWDYGIYPKTRAFAGYVGKILVPFSPESLLSGVNKMLTPEDVLYYHKAFDFNKSEKRVLLHFGAVDYSCEVTLNGVLLGSHQGGYTPFSFEITAYIKNGENDLCVRVTDPSQTGSQASGKQTFNRGNIWYTPQSGIWQTVWLEEVPESYIESVRLTPDIDSSTLRVEVKVNGFADNTVFTVFDNGNTVATAVSTEDFACIRIPEARLWSPEDPFLYDINIEIGKDSVKSYFGMRKFSVGTDENGAARFMLNNKPYFHNGLLDQGYWSDGMYTAPSDEALIYDIKTMKELGFNMLRKHIKIEPLRWYYHCDRLGVLVWQDMISGGAPVNPITVGAMPGVGLALGNKKAGHMNDGEKSRKMFSRADEAGIIEYYKDAADLIDTLYNCVSLCLWVPFNEGWGQFDALKVCDFFRQKDPTRIIDHASGWHDQGGGDVNSFHIYFTPFFFPKYSKKDNRVIALTEFGGYSMSVEGHRFNTEKVFGYRVYKTQQKLEKAIKRLYLDRLLPLVQKKGLSALVYTEVSDVEDETNGLLTYDREVLKVTPELMNEINSKFKL